MPRKPRAGEGMWGGLIIDTKPLMDSFEYAQYEKVDQQTISAKILFRAGVGRYPTTWLEATLAVYHIPNRGVKRDKIASLDEIVHDRRRLGPVLGKLSPEERAILSQVLAGGGFVKYQTVSRKYGDETEDGYFWSSEPPTSNIGRLRLCGLLFVGRMIIGQRREKILVIPSDLRDDLTSLLETEATPEPSVAPANESVYELDVALSAIEPPVWRRLSVPGTITLSQLNRAIQSAMGWNGSHSYEFLIDDQSYGDPDPDLETKSARRVQLHAVVTRPKRTFQYIYDLGDFWEHEITVRAVRPIQAGETVPSLLDGARACPPEDVGGIPGYEDFLRIIADPNDPEHQDTLEWAGGTWDPEDFNPEVLQRQLITNARRGRWIKVNT